MYQLFSSALNEARLLPRIPDTEPDCLYTLLALLTILIVNWKEALS